MEQFRLKPEAERLIAKICVQAILRHVQQKDTHKNLTISPNEDGDTEPSEGE